MLGGEISATGSFCNSLPLTRLCFSLVNRTPMRVALCLLCSIREEPVEGFVHDRHRPQSYIIDRQFFVTSAQRAILLVPTDHSLDDVSLPIRRFIEPLIAPLVRPRRDHRFDSP